MLPGHMQPQVDGDAPAATWVGCGSVPKPGFSERWQAAPTLGPVAAALGQAITPAHLDFHLQRPDESPAAHSRPMPTVRVV